MWLYGPDRALALALKDTRVTRVLDRSVPWLDLIKWPFTCSWNHLLWATKNGSPQPRDTAVSGVAMNSALDSGTANALGWDGRRKCEQIGNIMSSHNRRSGRKI